MRVPTTALLAAALDYAVAKAACKQDIKVFGPSRPRDRGWVEVRFNPEAKAGTARYDPSRSWDFAGPIIDREAINLGTQRNEPGFRPDPDRIWHAQIDTRSFVAYGPDPITAAMRCFVLAKIGETVDVPDCFC